LLLAAAVPVHGLFRTDRAASQLRMAAVGAGPDRIEGFHALPDRSVKLWIATQQRTSIVGHRYAGIGPLAEFLNEGWHPLPNSGQPEFGFHQLP
jgi:hypothetical protein